MGQGEDGALANHEPAVAQLTNVRWDIRMLSTMAGTIDRRVQDLEQILAHLPEDLDARFAGVDTKLAGMREVLALHTTRFTRLETRLSEIERGMDYRFDKLGGKLDEILQRLQRPS